MILTWWWSILARCRGSRLSPSDINCDVWAAVCGSRSRISCVDRCVRQLFSSYMDVRYVCDVGCFKITLKWSSLTNFGSLFREESGSLDPGGSSLSLGLEESVSRSDSEDPLHWSCDFWGCWKNQQVRRAYVLIFFFNSPLSFASSWW